jgi:RNA polymerase sigma factor (sigma-70 family)
MATVLAFASPRARGYHPPSLKAEDGRGMAGDALAAAFMTHRGALLRYLRARGAGEDAEDLLQELWFKLDGAGDAVVSDPLAYLYRMAHNLMLDRRRAALRRQTREQSYHRDGAETEPAPTAERSLMAREQLDTVGRALAALGERTDHIFRRHRVEEVPQREIAAELGISLSAVEKHLQKAYRAVAAAHREAQADGVAAGRETVDGAR